MSAFLFFTTPCANTVQFRSFDTVHFCTNTLSFRTLPLLLGTHTLFIHRLSSILLKLVSSFNSNVHYSFGDRDGNERSHIVVPAYTFFENFVVTKPGEPVPVLGEPFQESKQDAAARKATGGVGEWNTEDTYSMAYYSMYIDLPQWSIVKVPVAPNIDLRTFWGKSLLSIILYENTTAPSDGRHLTKDNSYFFCLQMKFLGKGAAAKKRKSKSPLRSDQSVTDQSAVSDDDAVLPWTLHTRQPPDMSLRTIGRSLSEAIEFTPMLQEQEKTLEEDANNKNDDNDDDDDFEYEFFDAEEEEQIHDDGQGNVSGVGTTLSTTTGLLPRSCLDQNAVSLANIDAVCPARIDIIVKNRYRQAYAFSFPNGPTLFRTESKASSVLLPSSSSSDSSNTNRYTQWSPRLSSSERTRRQLGEAFVSALSKDRSRVATFKSLCSDCDMFLRRDEPHLSSKRSRQLRVSGFVGRALSDRHWVEEWAKVTDETISFYHPERLQRSHYRVSLQNIDRIDRLVPSDCPALTGFYFLALQTPGRTLYLMFAIQQARDNWFEHLSQVIGGRTHQSNGTSSGGATTSKNTDGSIDGNDSVGSENNFIAIDDPADEFLHKSPMWNCKQRRILNCKSFAFKTDATAMPDPRVTVETALRRALEISDEADESQLSAFLQSTAALKRVNVSSLDETERLAFFLNLYHTMILHAFLVLGAPDSSFKWVSYFNVISYQCSDDIFSIAELEHCIIRAAMNYPSQFISKWVLPKSRYSFALTKPDYRINFALNSGSYSHPPFIPLYTPSRIHEQLDQSVRLVLTHNGDTVSCNKRSVVLVTLPRVCQWFADDFGKGSNTDVLKHIERYLPTKQRELLASCWSERHGRYVNVTVKHLSFSFECRSLAQLP